MRDSRVSVVMPVYNAAAVLDRAVGGVLAQTFADFEFLVIDDGSTDNSLERLRVLRDPRLRVMARPHEGVVRTMAVALDEARAELIARVDADDLCLPERLARQVAYLDAHPAVALVGGAIRSGAEVLTYPADTACIRWMALYHSPFGNPSLTFRRQAALAVGGYPEDHQVVDDYPFVSRMIERYEGANLPDVLVVKYASAGSITDRARDAQRAEGDRVRRRNLAALLGDQARTDALFYLLAGGPPPAGFRASATGRLLAALCAAYRHRWGIDGQRWQGLAGWVARELFVRALTHAGEAPGVLARMALFALSLDRGLVADPCFARGLLKHLVLRRVAA